MTVNEVRINAQLATGLKISDVVGLEWVKEAIEDICTRFEKVGARRSEIASIVTEPTDYALLNELVKLNDVVGVTDESEYELNSDNTITFKLVGEYTISYLSLPDMPTLVTSEVPLPFVFNRCLEYYLAYKIRSRLFGQGDNNAVSFYQQYEAELLKSENSRQRQKKKKRIPARRC